MRSWRVLLTQRKVSDKFNNLSVRGFEVLSVLSTVVQKRGHFFGNSSINHSIFQLHGENIMMQIGIVMF